MKNTCFGRNSTRRNGIDHDLFCATSRLDRCSLAESRAAVYSPIALGGHNDAGTAGFSPVSGRREAAL